MSELQMRLMEQLKALRAQVVALLHQLEDSMLFEKAVTWFENLEPRAQRWITGLGKVFALVILATPILWTLNTVRSLHSEQAQYLSLLDEMRRFNSDVEVVHQPPPRPAGWQNMNAGSADELQTSIAQYLGMIGISGDAYEISPSGAGILVKINELTIKQATSILFQMDGFFPRVTTPRVTLQRHPESKDLLTLEIEVAFRGGAMPAMNSGDDFSTTDMNSGPPPAVSRGGKPNLKGGTPGNPKVGTGPSGSNGAPSDSSSPPGGFDNFNTSGGDSGGSGDLPPPPFEDEM